MVIPLTVILIVYGIPVLYLELALGQYASLDSSLLFQRLTPILASNFLIRKFFCDFYILIYI